MHKPPTVPLTGGHAVPAMAGSLERGVRDH